MTWSTIYDKTLKIPPKLIGNLLFHLLCRLFIHWLLYSIVQIVFFIKTLFHFFSFRHSTILGDASRSIFQFPLQQCNTKSKRYSESIAIGLWVIHKIASVACIKSHKRFGHSHWQWNNLSIWIGQIYSIQRAKRCIIKRWQFHTKKSSCSTEAATGLLLSVAGRVESYTWIVPQSNWSETVYTHKCGHCYDWK